MARLALASSLLGSALLAACKVPLPEPDARWDVTVRGNTTTCSIEKDVLEYEKSYTYEVSWPNKEDGDVTTTEIRIDGEPFATGQTAGCSIEYASPTWLDEREQGFIKWGLVGIAEQQQGAGGCEIEKEFDWYGSETITVEESTDTSIPEGCTYTMTVEGQFLGGGG
jgi:hypothetical protein